MQKFLLPGSYDMSNAPRTGYLHEPRLDTTFSMLIVVHGGLLDCQRLATLQPPPPSIRGLLRRVRKNRLDAVRLLLCRRRHFGDYARIPVSNILDAYPNVELRILKRYQRWMLFRCGGSQSGGSVIAFEYGFCFGIILLQWHHGFLDALKAELFVRHLGRARLVLICSIVLDLLTGVFDFGEAQGRGGALKEMAERAQLGDVLGLSIIFQRVSP